MKKKLSKIRYLPVNISLLTVQHVQCTKPIRLDSEIKQAFNTMEKYTKKSLALIIGD